MKKLILALFTLAAGFATQSYAEALKDLKLELVRHAKECKGEWLEHAKSAVDNKFNLLKKHHDQEFDLKIAAINTMPEAGDKEAWKAHCLREIAACLQLKEAQMKEWENLHEQLSGESEALMNKDKEALTKFKAALAAVASTTMSAPSETVAELVVEPDTVAGESEVAEVRAIVAKPTTTDTIAIDLNK